ncbi:hypothetical protein [Amycolatopsis panacis]|uniref:hypothetical protein n=1 Tax=Amycolatopsis panacis TaxID=2340917 RepID=UPI001F43456E|nr:hypothetical protein [Amycolatopsis panacis]
MFRRHTDRCSLLDRPVSAAAQEKSRFAARTEGGQLEFLDTSSRYPRVTELLRRAEFAQASDPAFPAETERWAGPEPGLADDVPTTVSVPEGDAPGVLSPRSSRESQATAPREAGQGPVLTCDRGAPAEVRAGMALQRVLLTATADGLAASVLSQPFETPGTRRQLLALFHGLGQVHALLRIGYGLPVRTTADRPVTEAAMVRAEPDPPVRRLSDQDSPAAGRTRRTS